MFYYIQIKLHVEQKLSFGMSLSICSVLETSLDRRILFKSKIVYQDRDVCVILSHFIGNSQNGNYNLIRINIR